MTLRRKGQVFDACVREHHDYKFKYQTLIALRKPDVEVGAVIPPHTRSLFQVNLETAQQT